MAISNWFSYEYVHFHCSHMFLYERLELAPEMKFMQQQQATLALDITKT